MPPQRPAAQSTGGGFWPRPHLPASKKSFGTMEESARAMRRRGRVLHVVPRKWRLCSGAWKVANEPMPACAAGGRWAFRRRRASICNAFRLLAGLWGLYLGRRPSSQCRAPAFTRQDTPRRIADDKSMEENPHQFPQRCPTLALAPMGALLSCAGHPTFNPMGSIQADVRRVRRRVQREVPSGMR